MATTVFEGLIRVVASDATRIGCELLSQALQYSRQDFKVLACTSTVQGLLDAVEQHHPSVALVSTNLEDGPNAGMEALRTLSNRFPDTAFVLLADARMDGLSVRAFRAGAKGVFFRVDSFDMLCKCIQAVQGGQIWAGADEVRDILQALLSAVPMRVVNIAGDCLLTERQQQLVALVSEGMTNREIAQQLRLSEHTVKNYFFRIFDKLGVSNRAELIVYAMNQANRVAA